MDAKPKRRWSRFSLRTLLVLVTIACVGFGWLGYKMRQVQQQREKVLAIQKMGAFVQYDYQFDSATPPGPAWVRKLVGDDFFANIVQVAIYGEDVTNSQLLHLRGLTHLQYLGIGPGTQITDDGLVHLQGLTGLRQVSLEGTKVTDAGLVHMQGLAKLEELRLYDTRVSNTGILELSKAMPNLKIYGP